MSELFYRMERDADFYEACRRVQRRNPQLSAWRIAREATREKAKSFYLHRREYAQIIRTEGRRPPMNVHKREMYRAIRDTARQLLQNNPGLSLREVAAAVSTGPAPRFYMSACRARDIYYKMLKKHP
jgi:hypothetical protein